MAFSQSKLTWFYRKHLPCLHTVIAKHEKFRKARENAMQAYNITII